MGVVFFFVVVASREEQELLRYLQARGAGGLRAEWLTRGDNEAASFTASDSVRVLFLPPVELLSRGLAGNVQPRRLLISAVSGSRTRLGRDRPFF